MYFVPEGQHDSSQARSAWSHEENSLVPAGRLNGSGLSDRNSHKHVLVCEIQKIIQPWPTPFALCPGTDNDFDRPSGTGPLCIATQALRAWLLSACPSGTKATHPSSASH